MNAARSRIFAHWGAVLLAMGCLAAQAQTEDSAPATSADPTERMAHVHVYRPDALTGLAVVFDVSLDNLQGSLPNNGSLSRDIAPGMHEITLDRPAPTIDPLASLFYKPKAPKPVHLEFEAAPGTDYYFRLRPVMMQEDRLESVPPAEGAAALASSKAQKWSLEAPERLPNPTHLLPGDSLADYLLQRNVVGFLYRLEMKDCDKVKLTDIKVLSLPKKLGTSPWRENWIFDVCGVVKAYALEFTPTPNGTQMAFDVP